MQKIILVVVVFFICAKSEAQFVKERSIDVSVGLGISASYDDADVHGTGFYAQGEYVLTIAKWIDLRPYAGVIFTKANDHSQGYKASANAFLFGGKTRINAPIPWVAPYIEVGLGASIGSFETVNASVNFDDNGLFFHIPFSIGLELGPKHSVDIAFTYYFHNRAEQFAGAAAFGLSIPLNN